MTLPPLLRSAEAFSHTIEQLAQRCQGRELDAIVAVESRGFLFGAPLACRLAKPFVPVRKQGKLPSETVSVEYSLEYGSNVMEMHLEDISRGDRALILDDVLATGGTLAAAAQLVEKAGGEVAGIGLVIELEALQGRKALEGYDIFSLVQY